MMGLQPTGSVAWAVAVLMVLTGCGGSSPPDVPSSDTPSAVPGATTVYGTERLNWLQPGDVSDLAFRRLRGRQSGRARRRDVQLG